MTSDILLSVRNLGTRFKTNWVHHHFDLDIIKGEVFVLLGGSGSGKSTFLRTLIGLEKTNEGTCEYHGQDIFLNHEHEWKIVRQKMAYVFQGGALFDSLTVGENLSYPLLEHTQLSAEEREEKIATILKQLDLNNTTDLLPSSLSGGMQKRVGLARAMMMDPDLILYDEPTAGLDPANSQNIARTILKLKKAGKTSILVTHDTDCAVRVADRFGFIAEGKIAALQTIAEFKSQPHPLLKSYFDGEG